MRRYVMIVILAFSQNLSLDMIHVMVVTPAFRNLEFEFGSNTCNNGNTSV